MFILSLAIEGKFFIEENTMKEYMTIQEAAAKWNIGIRRINTLCSEGRLDGAIKFGGVWAIPTNANKPNDARVKSGKYVKVRK